MDPATLKRITEMELQQRVSDRGYTRFVVCMIVGALVIATGVGFLAVSGAEPTSWRAQIL